MRILKYLVLSVLFGVCGWLAYEQVTFYHGYITSLESDVAHTVDALRNLEEKSAKGAVIIKETKHTSWLDVQQNVKDTVVQVFSQSARFNWLEPYKAPAPSMGLGSGFFIDKDSHFITNYHVVDEAHNIYIQIPSLGKEQFEAMVVGVAPTRDIALLKLMDSDLERARARLGEIPYLTLGDSDSILRAQEILALGYPLGQQSLKSTQGIVSGREWIGHRSHIQITAPLNPGISGGPALSADGSVIGVNTSGVVSAQNIGYLIPISEVKLALDSLYSVKLLRRPTLGVQFSDATHELSTYLGNPGDGGWYITHVIEGGLFSKAGVEEGDMLYKINGRSVDRYGDISVPWAEDKVSLLAFLDHLPADVTMNLVLYRKGKRIDITFKLEVRDQLPIRTIYPEYESIDYEVFGGMVVMHVALNHLPHLIEIAPALLKYTKTENMEKNALIITQVLPSSQAQKSLGIFPGSLINEVNGKEVETLDDFRRIIREDGDKKFLTLQMTDKAVDKRFVALDLQKIIEDEDMLAARHVYKKSTLFDDLL